MTYKPCSEEWTRPVIRDLVIGSVSRLRHPRTGAAGTEIKYRIIILQYYTCIKVKFHNEAQILLIPIIMF